MKKYIAMIAAVCLLVTMGGCSEKKAEVTDVPATTAIVQESVAEVQLLHDLLTLGDTQVVHGGELINSAGEGWSYDAASGTLTLDGVNVSTYKEDNTGISALYCSGDLNLVLSGENSIDISGEETMQSATGICVLGQLYISGSGSLNVKSGKGAADSVGVYAVKGLTISGSTVEAMGGQADRSMGMASRDGISLEEHADVIACGGEATMLSAGMYTGQGSIIMMDSTVVTSGGDVICEKGTDTYAESCGIWANHQVSINTSDVTAAGGNVQAGDGQTAYSNGIYTSGGVDADFESHVTAVGGNAAGNIAHSRGIYCCENNVQVYTAVLNASSGEASGIQEALSCGILVENGGFYTYEDGADVTVTGGMANASSESGIAYANGVRVNVGDVGIDAGHAVITGGETSGAAGNSYGIFAEALLEENSAMGGCVSFESGAGAEITANDIAVWAQSDLELDDENGLTLPEGGVVQGIGGEPYFPDYWIITDSAGKAANHVVITGAE